MTTPYKTNYIVKNTTFLNCFFIQGPPFSVNELCLWKRGATIGLSHLSNVVHLQYMILFEKIHNFHVATDIYDSF